MERLDTIAQAMESSEIVEGASCPVVLGIRGDVLVGRVLFDGPNIPVFVVVVLRDIAVPDRDRETLHVRGFGHDAAAHGFRGCFGKGFRDHLSHFEIIRDGTTVVADEIVNIDEHLPVFFGHVGPGIGVLVSGH